MKKFWFLKFLKLIPFGIAFVVVVGYVVMYLWNWLMPVLFGLTALTFWQALGLLALSKILFGGFGGRSWGGGKHHYWKHRMSEKWDKMTPEQKEEFKKAMKSRFGFWKDNFETGESS